MLLKRAVHSCTLLYSQVYVLDGKFRGGITGVTFHFVMIVFIAHGFGQILFGDTDHYM